MDQLTRIERSLAQLETKLDILLTRDAEQDKRIRVLEDDKLKSRAIGGLMGALFGYLAKFVLPGALAFVYVGDSAVLPKHTQPELVILIDKTTGGLA